MQPKQRVVLLYIYEVGVGPALRLPSLFRPAPPAQPPLRIPYRVVGPGERDGTDFNKQECGGTDLARLKTYACSYISNCTALFTQAFQAGVAIALCQPAAGFVSYKPVVAVVRGGQVQQNLQQAVDMGGVKKILAAGDMTYALQGVINNNA